MSTDTNQLRRDALRIWQAGLEAVRSERLVKESLRVEGPVLAVGDEQLRLDGIRRIVVVGAGKAGAGMAAAVEEILGPRLMEEKQLTGWVNVPADCVTRTGTGRGLAQRGTKTSASACETCAPSPSERPLERITLHAARPAGVNEPTSAGVAGAAEILRLVTSLGPDDLCLCLISGGGSALMPAPVEGITLEDKLAVTRYLSAVGANIEQLNTVRKQLSRIKGGGLARACRAGRLVSLIISDVLGDPLDVIASGPTVEDTSTPRAAIEVLDAFAARDGGVSPAIFAYLDNRDRRTESHSVESDSVGAAVALPPPAPSGRGGSTTATPTNETVSYETRVTNLVIGNNVTAVDAAGMEAERLGYSHAMICASRSEGPAEQIGRHLADMAMKMRSAPGPNCLISGGEPVVTLCDAAIRGLGGRNQQLTLSALMRLVEHGPKGIVLLSGGTDGEDGPTDAAGAVVDAEVIAAARQCQLDPADYLARNDAYNFFRRAGGLIRTGPTHTNVCDVRVVLVARKE
jgi:glycerate 2-kinase